MLNAAIAEEALIAGFAATQVGEALTNYQVADAPLEQHLEIMRSLRPAPGYKYFDDDGQFWAECFAEKQNGSPPATDVLVWPAAVSEWVARVPGLFWRPGSAAMRTLRPADRESETERWITFKPKGKSQLVSGGVGTLKFPPSEDGFRMITLTTSHNASTGVPALVSPKVWKSHGLTEGTIVNGRARWAPLPLQWSTQFPVVLGVPRGCLILDDVAATKVMEQNAPVQVHPFSVMEYWEGPAQLHDFVYITVDTGDPDLRRTTADFFEEYRTKNGRDGHYLLAADISDPLWEATFTSPAEMRLNKAVELRLIEARVAERARGEDVTEALIRNLGRFAGTDDLKRLSQDADIPWRRWSKGGRIADEAARLVAEAVELGKQQKLLQFVMLELK
jgi:hypothetical protein